MVRKFKNAAGVEWIVKVTVDVIERVREIGVDLGDITAATMKRLAMDDVLLVRTMWLACEPQAEKAGVTPAQFGEAMVGDTLDDAYEALRGGLEDFFPSRKRSFWLKMLATDQEVQAQAMEMGLAALADQANKEEISRALKTRIEAEMAATLKRLRSATG